jgi:hypothetical protein
MTPGLEQTAFVLKSARGQMKGGAVILGPFGWVRGRRHNCRQELVNLVAAESGGRREADPL